MVTVSEARYIYIKVAGVGDNSGPVLREALAPGEGVGHVCPEEDVKEGQGQLLVPGFLIHSCK
jgi:hypothetical protein